MRVLDRKAYVQADHFVSSNGTNPQNMFNAVVGEATTHATALVVVITPGRINTLALLGLVGTSVSVVGEVDSVEVYNQTRSLRSNISSTWSEYFFDPPEVVDRVILDDIPVVGGIELTITVTGTDAACGSCLYGTLRTFGDTEYGASIDFVSYATKDVAVDGKVTLSPGPSSRRISASVFLQNSRIERLYEVLARLDAQATLWMFADTADLRNPLTLYGFFRDVSVVIPYPKHSLCSVEIEGLV